MTQETQATARPNVRVVLFGLMIAMMLAMLDNMIVSTALPRIVGEFGGVDHFTWVVTAYVLGTTVSTPIWGKLGDLYGRKAVFLTSVVIFLIGSALCGMAGSDMFGGSGDGMVELIAFRAVQGLGAGGLMVGVMAIIGDLVPPRERGRYQGMIAGIMTPIIDCTLPLSRGGTRTPMIASAPTIRPPAPSPCTARKAMSWPMSCDRPASMDPARKITIEVMNVPLRP